MNALEAGLSCSGGFCVLGDAWALQGEFRREKCNMLQKSLVEMVLRVNSWKKKENLEEKSATCCKNLLQKWR